MKIEVELSEDGGPYKAAKSIDLPAVPRLGDMIETRGGGAVEVRSVFWRLDGTVLIRAR